MPTTTVHRFRDTAAATGLAGLLLLGGACSLGSHSAQAKFSAVGSSINGAAGPSLSGGGITGAGASSAGDSTYQRSTAPERTVSKAANPELTAATLGRKLVSTASLTVQVHNLDNAEAGASDVAAQVGGAVFGERSQSGAGGVTSLTLKVPPERFRDALTRLETLGKRVAKSITTDDVTQQVVDVDSRVRTMQASIARVQALFDKAGTVVEVAQLDNELQQRQADLESLLGQQRTLKDQVDLATITLTLTLTRHVPPPPKPHHAPPKGFRAGLHAGGHALAETGRVVSLVGGVLLPWMPVLFVAGCVVWLASRRRRTLPTTPAPSPPSPTVG